MYKGIGASAGIGIGKVVVIKEQSLDYKKETITDAEAEKKRLSEAIEVFIDKTAKMVEAMKVTAGEQESEILEGHILMIQDPAIKEQIDAKIDDEKINAEAAVEEACDFFAQIFAMAEDELTQQRASDLGDIKTRLIKILLGIERCSGRNCPGCGRFDPVHDCRHQPGQCRGCTDRDRRQDFPLCDHLPFHGDPGST